MGNLDVACTARCPRCARGLGASCLGCRHCLRDSLLLCTLAYIMGIGLRGGIEGVLGEGYEGLRWGFGLVFGMIDFMIVL